MAEMKKINLPRTENAINIARQANDESANTWSMILNLYGQECADAGQRAGRLEGAIIGISFVISGIAVGCIVHDIVKSNKAKKESKKNKTE